MAYAAYAEVFGANALEDQALRPCKPELWVLDLRVSVDLARQARQILANCPGVGVLRCRPHPLMREVDLEVLLPARQHAALVHAVLAGLPNAQFGRLQNWARVMRHQGERHAG